MNPIIQALGPTLNDLAAPVRAHCLMTESVRSFEGRMAWVWRQRGWKGRLTFPGLWLGSLYDQLFTRSGRSLLFRLENRMEPEHDGTPNLARIREFACPGHLRQFKAVLTHGGGRCLKDRLGHNGALEVELWPSVHAGALNLLSGRHWVHVLGLRIPIPRLLAGQAWVHEWAIDARTLGIRVEVWNPWLGCVFGYEGSFRSTTRAWKVVQDASLLRK